MDMNSQNYISSFLVEYPDRELTVKIARLLVNAGGGLDSFISNIGACVRQAYDEVIDMPRTQRYSIDQLEKTEKTYIGTKVEILVRNALDLKKGTLLDLSVNGYEVDIKNTVGSSWMIPKEAIDQHCLLIQAQDKTGTMSIGILHCTTDVLSSGMNQDQKRSVSPGNKAIFWIARKVGMPKNFFEDLPLAVLKNITDNNASGAERVRRLCRLVPNKPISRQIIECVAQQKDPMKRLRKNGGARDDLAKENILVLGMKYDSEALKKYGFIDLNDDDWVAVHPDLLKIS